MQVALGKRNLHAVSVELLHDCTIDIRAHLRMSPRTFVLNPKPHVLGRVPEPHVQDIGSGVLEDL